MTPTTTKWILFFSMCAIVPVFYFMFVVAGFLPLLAVLVIASNNIDSWTLLLISVVHCLIYAAIFYLISVNISRRLTKLAPPQRNKRLSLIIGTLLLIGVLPIYGGGHGRFEWKSAYQIYLNYRWLR